MFVLSSLVLAPALAQDSCSSWSSRPSWAPADPCRDVCVFIGGTPTTTTPLPIDCGLGRLPPGAGDMTIVEAGTELLAFGGVNAGGTLTTFCCHVDTDLVTNVNMVGTNNPDSFRFEFWDTSTSTQYELAGDRTGFIRGLGGQDVLFGSPSMYAGYHDHLDGGDDHDFLESQSGADTLYGGAGMDTFWSLGGDDVIWCGPDDDWVHAGGGEDTIYGEGGNDVIYGSSGDDTIYGGDGEDWIDGDEGDDTLQGDGGNDHLYGDEDDDVLSGGVGADELCPEPAATTPTSVETVYGHAGTDTLATGGWLSISGNMGNDADTCPTTTTVTSCNVASPTACSWTP